MNIPANTELNRDKKELSREYVTVPLSDTRVDAYRFRCYRCGRPVQTLHNKVISIIQAKVIIDDIPAEKHPMEGFCKDDNIMFIFV